MRLGIFGGSFDPVHHGHLGLARAAVTALGLDDVLFVPAFAPPHKPDRQLAPVVHRVAMLELAIAGDAALSVSRLEADAGRAVYTIDTVRALKRHYGPDVAMVLLLGWDSWVDLPQWREAKALRALVHVAVAPRPGHASVVEEESSRGMTLIPAAPHAISASDIRARVARGEDIDALVPAAVAGYIASHRLYRDA